MSIEMELHQATKDWLELANEVFQRQFTMPVVLANVRGRVAGWAHMGANKIRYNADLYAANKVDFINRTVPHELAHLITRTLYPAATAHGSEWRSVMSKLGVEDITRCHKYDTTAATLKTIPRPYAYKCHCTTHMLTGILHRRIQQGSYRICKKCRGKLEHNSFFTFAA